ncbi:hypothetical protein [Methylobacterium sp. AMS5]|uniref:hypothetical protein n=1 Tax=Methylobacterium sp. AMS5 TaxID=925818 RepID=UPI00074F9471|nr:hypothetical protein [Methylobacterium sp. AMS5]AMB45691.1 hypothetical protein Y590_12305 [Methylobacterium sp. AMS5]
MKAFDTDRIRVLLGLGAVRCRPRLYIGDTEDGTGLHNMVLATVNSALRERSGHRAGCVRVTLDSDDSCTVSDDGPGLSADPGGDGDIGELEAVMTRLNPQDLGGGLEKAGLCVVNTLSHWLRIESRTGGKSFDLAFQHGVKLSPVGIRTIEDDLCGTTISFRPSADTFTERHFDGARLKVDLEGLSHRSGVRIEFSDARGNPAA